MKYSVPARGVSREQRNLLHREEADHPNIRPESRKGNRKRLLYSFLFARERGQATPTSSDRICEASWSFLNDCIDAIPSVRAIVRRDTLLPRRGYR
jgi:hypothetical protein